MVESYENYYRWIAIMVARAVVEQAQNFEWYRGHRPLSARIVAQAEEDLYKDSEGREFIESLGYHPECIFRVYQDQSGKRQLRPTFYRELFPYPKNLKKDPGTEDVILNLPITNLYPRFAQIHKIREN